MECRPFRFKQRRTSVSGKEPSLLSLYDGELYLNTVDGKAFFKDKNSEKLFTFITDSSGNGLNNIKFSGANTGDIPIWNGSGFSAGQVDASGSVKTTGDQLISGIKSFDSCIVLTGNFPRIVDFGNNFTLENGMGFSLNAPNGLSINALDSLDSSQETLYKNFAFYSESYSAPTFRLPADSCARAYIVIDQYVPSVGSNFELTDNNGIAYSFIVGPIGDKNYSITIDQNGTVEEAANSIVQTIIDSSKFSNVHYSSSDKKIWIYQKEVGILGNRDVTVGVGIEGIAPFDGGTSRIVFGDNTVQTTAFNGANFVKISGNQTVSGIKNFDQRPTINGTGVLLSGEASNLDDGLFLDKGDSEYLTYFARGLTTNNNWTKLSSNGSNSLYDMQFGDDVYFIVNITAAGNGKNAIFKIEGGAKRGLEFDETIEYDTAVLLSSNIKNIIYRSVNTYDVRVIVQSGSIKIECLGDSLNELRWYAKIEILKLNSIYS